MENLENAIVEIKEKMPGLKLLENEPMSSHCSFRIGGPVRALAAPKDVTGLSKLCHLLKTHHISPLLLGNGTNILFPDEGLKDLFIISTENLTKMFLLPDGAIYAEAGVSLAKLASFAQQNGLAGLEFASGIPGTVGGGVRMNAGAYGGEMKQVVTSVTVFRMDGTEQMLSAEASAFGYRTSVYQTLPCVIVRASLQLQPGDPNTIEQTMRALMEKRKASQPLELPSAGSTFKRPVGYFAGPLIEQAGLKGQGIGGAAVSEKHAGFVVNCGGATTDDIRRTMELVQTRVLETSGVQLEPEVRIW